MSLDKKGCQMQVRKEKVQTRLKREAAGSISRLRECFRRNNNTKTSSFHPNSTLFPNITS